MEEDDYYIPEPVMGRADATQQEDEEHPFTGWLYVPDLSSTTGWTAYELRRPEPPQKMKHVGFRRGS